MASTVLLSTKSLTTIPLNEQIETTDPRCPDDTLQPSGRSGAVPRSLSIHRSSLDVSGFVDVTQPEQFGRNRLTVSFCAWIACVAMIRSRTRRPQTQAREAGGLTGVDVIQDGMDIKMMRRSSDQGGRSCVHCSQ